MRVAKRQSRSSTARGGRRVPFLMCGRSSAGRERYEDIEVAEEVVVMWFELSRLRRSERLELEKKLKISQCQIICEIPVNLSQPWIFASLPKIFSSSSLLLH